MEEQPLNTEEQQFVVGIEFMNLTHWDRYILNENLAKLEKKVYPDMASRPDDRESDAELWRGNKRRFYRLDTRSLDLYIELDFQPSQAKHYQARVMNLSPAGCRLLLPMHESIREDARIPRIRLKFDSEELLLKARVSYVTVYSDGSFGSV